LVICAQSRSIADCFVAVPPNECPFFFKNVKSTTWWKMNACESNLKNGDICEYVPKYQTDPDPRARARNCHGPFSGHGHNVFRYVCGTCEDNPLMMCRMLKPNGACTSPLYKKHVEKYCRKTCGFCGLETNVANGPSGSSINYVTKNGKTIDLEEEVRGISRTKCRMTTGKLDYGIQPKATEARGKGPSFQKKYENLKNYLPKEKKFKAGDKWPIEDVPTMDACSEKCLKLSPCTAFEYYKPRDREEYSCYPFKGIVEYIRMWDYRKRYAGHKKCDVSAKNHNMGTDWFSMDKRGY